MTLSHRLHALDNLRAAMMWLGIVLHVCVNHIKGPSPLPWRDERTTQWADLAIAFIHAFRMPVFFILAGFFVAMLLERRGPGGMLRHRVARLALPFVVFWPPIFVAMAVAGLLFLHRMAHGTFGIDPSLMPSAPNHPRINTAHLWFLYLLFWFSALTALTALIAGRWRAARGAGSAPAGTGPWTAASAFLQSCAVRPWGPLLLALPPALAGMSYPDGIVVPGGSFLPPWQEWLHNGVYYAFGLALHSHRQALLAHFQRRAGLFGAAGFVFFMASGALVGLPDRASLAWQPVAVAWVYNVASWCWSFALIGASLRWLSRPNRVLRYLSQSSYWVYLVHMIGTIGFGALLCGVDLPAGAKIVLNIALTSAASLLSYRWLVRDGRIGRMLNGAGPGNA